ncbi:MAG: YfiR family protein [Cytophagales bacterium]|nr:YfiR family protein [Cytophagales bacterium]
MRKVIFFALLATTIANSGYGQKEKYQSLFIYNFTKYIKWPESYNPNRFVIGVIGSSKILESLNAMTAAKKKTVNGKVLEIKKYSSVSEIDDCNILFISEDMSGELGQIEHETSSKPVLIVTDVPGLAAQGSMVNFVEQDGKIKFELNRASVDRRGLIVSGSLINLAILI